MNDIQKVEKFNYFEKLYFRLTLVLLGAAVVSFGLLYLVVDYLSIINKFVSYYAVMMLIAIFGNFIISIVRFFKYFIKISKLDNNIGILRTVGTILLSPISFIIVYILIIVVSFSSCTIQ